MTIGTPNDSRTLSQDSRFAETSSSINKDAENFLHLSATHMAVWLPLLLVLALTVVLILVLLM